MCFCFIDLPLVGVRSLLNIKKQTAISYTGCEGETLFLLLFGITHRMQRGSSRAAHPAINEQKGADSPGRNGLLTRERVNLLLYFWSIIHNLLENSFQHCHPISLQSFLIFRFSQAELTVIKGESVCPPCIRFNRTWLVYTKNKMKVREKKYIECWKNA